MFYIKPGQVGTNMTTLVYVSYHICNENIGRKNIKILASQETDRPWTDRTEQYASKEECIKWN